MKSDKELRDAVTRSFGQVEQGSAPSFEKVWAAAETQVAASRRRYVGFAVAATLAVVAIALTIQSPPEEPPYIEAADLLGSTTWSAPSDVLLPKKSFDIYQEMPALFESTDLAGGTLL